MERAAGFAQDDTTRAKLDKIDVLLAQSFTARQEAALLADMLSVPNDGRYPSLELDPQQRRQKTLEALTGSQISSCRRLTSLSTQSFQRCGHSLRTPVSFG